MNKQFIKDNYDKIIKLYCFDELTKNAFSYFSDYDNSIKQYLMQNKLNEVQVFKYILVYFISDFLASVHHQSDFNTFEIKEEDFISSEKETARNIADLIGKVYLDEEVQDEVMKDFYLQEERKRVFNLIYGKPLESADEYLKLLIPIDVTKKITGNILHNFIISSK